MQEKPDEPILRVLGRCDVRLSCLVTGMNTSERHGCSGVSKQMFVSCFTVKSERAQHGDVYNLPSRGIEPSLQQYVELSFV
ncbi:unnamed protein product [Gadus morhua 'NCC']